MAEAQKMSAEERVKIVQVQYPLARVKDIFTLRCFNSKFYSALKFFLLNLKLEWNWQIRTMAAYKKGGYRTIGIAPAFVADHCRQEEDVADCVFHEVMHHVFHHLDEWAEVTKNRGLANVAMDAIINAYLYEVGSSGFFEHFYLDTVCQDGRWLPQVFLRRNSTRFSVVTRDESKLLAEVDNQLYRRFNSFYQKLYRLEVTLEEAVGFFRQFFPEASNEDLHDKGREGEDAGDGEPKEDKGPDSENSDGGNNKKPSEDSDEGKGSGQKGEDENPQSPSENESDAGDDKNFGDDSYEGDEIPQAGPGPWQPSGRHEGGYDQPEDFLDKDTADSLLNVLGLKKLTKKVQNNFLRIIRKISNASDRLGGGVRQGSYFSQRVPGKFNKKNALRAGLRKQQFAHGSFKMESVALILDQSGSMSEYIEFGQKLVQWLVKIGKDVRCIVFADKIKEFPASEMIAGKIPNVGGGTCGEVVAQFIAREKIPDVIIVTDNFAGSLTTPIKAKVHLALVEGSSGNGTFSNQQKVPKCTRYWLEKEKEIQY